MMYLFGDIKHPFMSLVYDGICLLYLKSSLRQVHPPLLPGDGSDDTSSTLGNRGHLS